MVRRCSFGGCPNKCGSGISFYGFPSDVWQRTRWSQAVKQTRVDWDGPKPHSVVCSEHFPEESFDGGKQNALVAIRYGYRRRPKLKSNAVPSPTLRLSSEKRGGTEGAADVIPLTEMPPICLDDGSSIVDADINMPYKLGIGRRTKYYQKKLKKRACERKGQKGNQQDDSTVFQDVVISSDVDLCSGNDRQPECHSSGDASDMTGIASSDRLDPTTDGCLVSTSSIQLTDMGFSDGVLNALNRLREQAVLTDAIICAEDQEIHCHKVVLSSCSDVFCRMFSTSTNNTTQRIHTSIASADTMRKIINFVYKGTTEVQRSELEKLHTASKHFGVTRLSKLCERFLGISREEPVLDSVGSDDVEAGGQQTAEKFFVVHEMPVTDLGTQPQTVERVKVKKECTYPEIGDRISRNKGIGHEVMDWESGCHGNNASNSASTQCQSTSGSDIGNQGQCQSFQGERSDTYGAKTAHEETISVKTEPVLLDDPVFHQKTISVKTEPALLDEPEHWHSRSYQNGDRDLYSASGISATHQSSADTNQDPEDASNDDSQQFYIATELNDDAMATGDSFQGERRGSTELSSMATGLIAAGHGGNNGNDNTRKLHESGREAESDTASHFSNTSSSTGYPVTGFTCVYPSYNRADHPSNTQAATFTSRSCMADTEPTQGVSTGIDKEKTMEVPHKVEPTPK
ncbi:uncharacterized protein [Ptychodera flava]|uniref:uncharacterized protein isoform X3 n=1 Tax=Ptychodera flava TaxID=63121 RepID=UPI00396A4323